MKKCGMIKLPAFGKKAENGLTLWANARSDEQLRSEGFKPISEDNAEYKHYGVCLKEDMVLCAGSDDPDIIADSAYGFYPAGTVEEAIRGGRYLWVKKFGKKEFLEPYGY